MVRNESRQTIILPPCHTEANMQKLTSLLFTTLFSRELGVGIGGQRTFLRILSEPYRRDFASSTKKFSDPNFQRKKIKPGDATKFSGSMGRHTANREVYGKGPNWGSENFFKNFVGTLSRDFASSTKTFSDPIFRVPFVFFVVDVPLR